MTDKYCPRNEIGKLEMELWELKVKGTNLASYTQRFQELALLCGRMFAEEADKIEKYVRAPGGKKQYGGSKPLCAKCNYHHDGPCAPKCHNCNNIGHLARDCRVTINTNNANNQRGTELGQKPTCYECGVKGHYKRDYPKLKNNNDQRNQGGRNNAPARVYAIGRAGADPDANVVTGTFLLNNRYAGHYKRECPKLKNNNNQGNQGGRNNAPDRVHRRPCMGRPR
nr:hypothetical protein [Tanacetum cinerariifolium]